MLLDPPAGGQRRNVPKNVKTIRVMCSGRMDPQFIIDAFHKGADGVMILGCHIGDCHYKEGNLMMLRRMKPNDPLMPNAEAIRMSVSRTVTLTQKLLAFGRKQFLALRRVDINTVIGDLDVVVRKMLSGVRLDLILDPELGLARADQDQLEEAILTLVRNSCTAMPHGGQLTIQTANVEFGENYARDHPEVRPGPYVLMAVSDTGMGMGQEEISHLFEPFHTTTARVGAGLAMAAVYGFIKQSGGDIEVRSQPEHGTTFRIYLPRDARVTEMSKPSV